MQNKILFQSSQMSSNYLDQEFVQVVNSGFDYDTYGIIPFTNKLTGLFDLDPSVNYIVRGSTKILDSLKDLDFSQNVELKEKFIKGIFYNPDNFRYSKFARLTFPSKKLPLLNQPIAFLETKYVLDLIQDEDYFIKPDSDLKYFPAVVVPKGKTLRQVLEDHQLNSKYEQDSCIIAKARFDIQRECRFFVVNKQVVTGSQYRLNNRTDVKPLNDADDINFVAQRYTDLYQPHDNFVIDIATLADGSYKIIEYNCLNASGLYKCNSKVLFTKLFEYLNDKI